MERAIRISREAERKKERERGREKQREAERVWEQQQSNTIITQSKIPHNMHACLALPNISMYIGYTTCHHNIPSICNSI